MHRYILTIGPMTLYSYGALLAAAFIAGTRLAVARGRARGVRSETVYDLVFYIIVSSVAGARLLFVAMNAGHYAAHPLDILRIWEGGLVLYGGVLSGLAVSIVYLKRKGLAVWKIADIFAPPLALGFAIGRIGCFLNGCCYGIVSETFGVRFPAVDMPPAYYQQLSQGLIQPGATHSLPVLPTQLYESAACLFILWVLLFIERRRKMFDGFFFWLFILMYSAARFALESVRFYEPSFYFSVLTLGQWMSLGLMLAAAAFIILNNRPLAQKA